MNQFLSALIFFAFFFSLATAQQERPAVEFLPSQQFVPSFTADGTAHRLSYLKDVNRGSFYAGLGGGFPAALVHLFGYDCLITVSGTVYTTLASAGVKFQVTNADYYADVTFDIPVAASTVLRLGSGHTSHHLVDDAVAAVGATSVLNYARDYVQCFAVQRLPLLRGFAYAGVFYNRSFLINVHRDGLLLWQAGLDAGSFTVAGPVEAYGALDVKVRGEVNNATTQSYQAGLRVKNDTFRAVRLAYTFRTGAEERGQFYDKRFSSQTVGMFFDF